MPPRIISLINGEHPSSVPQVPSGPSVELTGQENESALIYGYFSLYDTSTGLKTMGTLGFQAGPAELPENPLVPGVIYKNNYDYPITIYIPVTFFPTSSEAATFSIAIGPDENLPLIPIIEEQVPAGFSAGIIHTEEVRVPANNLFSVEGTQVTINPAVAIGI